MIQLRSLFTIAIQLVLLGAYGVGLSVWQSNPQLLAIDLRYLFIASWSELRTFFPNYYWAIYGVARFLQYGILLFGTYLLLRNKGRVAQFVLRYWRMQGRPRWSVLAPFFVGLAASLALYFALPLSFEAQRLLTQIFIGWAVIDVLLLFVANKEQAKKWLFRFLLRPQMPYSLAITRILFYAYTIVLSGMFINNFQATIGALDKAPLPYIGWLIELIPVTPEMYLTACIIVGVAGGFAAIGYKTRFWQVVHAIAIFYMVATPNFFGKLSHNQILIWISWIMAVSPCADVLSIDAMRKPKKAIVQSGKYSFHLRIIWLHFGIIYFFAGFFKLWLCGFDWALTNSMINQIQIEWFEHFDRVPSLRFDHFPVLLKAAGLATIVFELAYIFMLFHKHLRWISILGGLAMHNIIGKIMYIAFLHLLQAFYIVFIPWNAVLQKLKLVSVANVVPTRFSLLKPVYLIPVLIFAANMLASVFNINSYPFSVYPVYAEIVPDNVKYFEYRVRDKEHKGVHVWEEGKRVGFKWERYSRTEYHTIRTWEVGNGLDTHAVKTLWSRWQLASEVLDNIDSVDVYVVERPLAPERKSERISEKYLMSIYQKPKRHGN